MSELIQKHDNRATIRWKLLTSASAFALMSTVSTADLAHADDTDRPQLWIELGGQLSQLDDSQVILAPAFLADRPSIFAASQPLEKPSRFSIDEFADLSFQPDNSDWVFSASIRYGRSKKERHLHQQTYPKPLVEYYYDFNNTLATFVITRPVDKFADTNVSISEKHSILDFQAGKDVGLGMFGSMNGSSVVSVGVRFAQFASRSNIALKSDPDVHPKYYYIASGAFKTPVHGIAGRILIGGTYHANTAVLTAARSFRGIGPSLSWSASAPFAGNTKDGELTADWGVNAALLFGRQRVKVHHQTTVRYHTGGYVLPSIESNGGHFATAVTKLPATPDHTRTRNVTVPNIGGFAGISFKYADAKVSLGYRADFFFNAMDGGIDTRKNEDRAFYGPYASISVGLGD